MSSYKDGKKAKFFDNVVHSEVYALHEKRKIEIKTVYSGDILYLDMREWQRWHQDEEWHPTKKGIFIELRQFKEHIKPLIDKVLEV